MALVGDSSGGGLTLALLLALRDAGEPLPKTAVCLSPWVDLAHSGDSFQSKITDDPLLSPTRLKRFADLYLNGSDSQTPLASPLYADLAGLPPLLIQVGTAELLLDDATRLAERAEAAGVEVTLAIWEEMIHVWHAFAAFLPEAQEALTQVGDFIQTQLE